MSPVELTIFLHRYDHLEDIFLSPLIRCIHSRWCFRNVLSFFFFFFVSIYNCYRLVIIVGRNSLLVNFNLYCIIISCITNANDDVYHIKLKIQVKLCQTILHHLRYQRYQLKIKMSSKMVDYSPTGICCAKSRSLHSISLVWLDTVLLNTKYF